MLIRVIVMLPFEDLTQAKDTYAAAKTDILDQREDTNAKKEEDRTSLTPMTYMHIYQNKPAPCRCLAPNVY